MHLSKLLILGLCGNIYNGESFRISPHQTYSSRLSLQREMVKNSNNQIDHSNYLSEVREIIDFTKEDNIRMMGAEKKEYFNHKIKNDVNMIFNHLINDMVEKRKKVISDAENTIRYQNKNQIDIPKFVLASYFALKEFDLSSTPLICALLKSPSLLRDMMEKYQADDNDESVYKQLPKFSELTFDPLIQNSLRVESFKNNKGLIRLQEYINNMEDYEKDEYILKVIKEKKLQPLIENFIKLKNKVGDNNLLSKEEFQLDEKITWKWIQCLVYYQLNYNLSSSTNQNFKNTLIKFYNEFKKPVVITDYSENVEYHQSIESELDLERLYKMANDLDVVNNLPENEINETIVQENALKSILHWLLIKNNIILPPWS